MKILIVSDTHAKHGNLDYVLEQAGSIDLFIHLGDVEGDEEYLDAVIECEKHIVRGNNDFFSRLPREEEFDIGKYHVFITHGHYYYVSMDVDTIIEEARSRNADIVMFGHTHKPYFSQKDGLTVLNPGSLSYPRQDGRKPSYMVMEIDEEGKAHLDNIGEIHYNIYGNYEFVPYDYKITTPSLYGLDSFEMHELSVLQQKEKVWIPAHPEKEKKTFEISINRAYLRNAAAMIAAIVLFFAFSTPVENTDVQKNNYAQLLPSELFEQIEKQSVVVTPVYVKSDAMQQAKKLSATASTSSSTKTSSTKKNTADKTSKPIAVREVKVAKQETAATTSATAPAAVKSPESANHPFHIIVAGGISLKDAEAIATQLKSKGFANAKALNMDGKVRVSINSFDNRNEATKQLLELRKNETYKNAWLLAK